MKGYFSLPVGLFDLVDHSGENCVMSAVEGKQTRKNQGLATGQQNLTKIKQCSWQECGH